MGVNLATRNQKENVMSKWKLQGMQRENFLGIWRGGRFWPSGEWTEVEVLDDDACPLIEVADPKAPGGRRQCFDPVRIGRVRFAQIMADSRISKVPADGEWPVPPDEVVKLRKQVADLEAKLAAGPPGSAG